jgi:hypothetical protein
LRAIRTKLFENIVEFIINAVVKRKVTWEKILILQHFSFKLLDHLFVEIGDLERIFLI